LALESKDNDTMIVSLCQSGSFANEIVSGKGSRFLLCQKSRSDLRFPKYPRQPVVACDGFVKKDATTNREQNDTMNDGLTG